jgi:hypothetical protein
MTPKESAGRAKAKLAPWVRNPGGLVSLLFMLRAFAAEFAQFVDALASVTAYLQGKVWTHQAAGGEDEELSEEQISKYFAVPLGIGQTLANDLSLDSVNDQLDRIRSEIKFRLTLARTVQLLDRLGERLVDDLGRCWFFFVKPQYVKAYKEPMHDWGDVKDKFPSAVYDAEEAAKALALERATATVFHLMRVLERGLRALADDLQIPVANQNPNWNEAIEQLEKRVTKQMPNSDPKAVNRQFYNQAILQFRLFKDAVRNYVIHEPAVYNQPQAEGHYNAVRDFMRHLATLLSE